MVLAGSYRMGERMSSIIFWISVGIVALLGLRHLFSILVGCDQCGLLKPGQRICHATSFLFLMGSSVFAVIFKIWWPLLAGVVLEYLYRRFTIWTGENFPLSEEEKQMTWKEFLKHIYGRRSS